MLSLRFATVPVQNQQRAFDWYVEKLSCTVVQDVPFGSNARWIELAFPGAKSNIVLFTPPGYEERVGTFLGLSFTSDNIEAEYQEMMERGVHFVEPLAQADWGGQQAIFEDSEGNKLVLASRE